MTGQHRRARVYVEVVTTLAGLGMLAAGSWALAAPGSFAEFTGFATHVHFLHDAGAFQLGLGTGLLLALIWADALATVLAGFLLANTVHTVNHATDLDLGGNVVQAVALGVVSVLLAVALVLRLRGRGYVVGAVTAATVPALAPFVAQKTISLTTFRRDGRPGASPVSIAVEGDHAYVRSFEKSLKTRRLARDPRVEFAPSTGRGVPTGPAVDGKMRRLEGEENRHAATVLRRKHPLLHGVVVPLAHRLGRAKTGRTVHFELTPM
ncbi:PPOX class F420-dependent oxidoreductase [Prauserella flavalba]|uniref:PPOX class F420-dependent oxidoreductase n=1 Tax=Prauserella flavalba TaxID=1477506 RepID=UPI000D772FA0|nr:PPOX class F420-dependent oxidoreductase [Prauserella flavalba]